MFCLNNFYQDTNSYNDETWERNKELYDKDQNGIPLIEYKIRDWIINFIKEMRNEWFFLLEKETIEERNWKLLNEIENFLLKK